MGKDTKEVKEQIMQVSGERVFVLVRRNNNCRSICVVFEKQKEEACVPLFWELRGETGRRRKRERGYCRADEIGLQTIGSTWASTWSEAGSHWTDME